MGRLNTLKPRIALAPARTLGAAHTERVRGRPWMRARDRALQRDNGLCRECADHGRVTLATQVDHIVPLHLGGAALDEDNLRSLCDGCHDAKTKAEAGARAAGGG